MKGKGCGMRQVKTQLFLGKGQRGQQKIDTEKPLVGVRRVPRISRLMALAIQFEGLLRDGVVCDQSELARLAYLTQPRMTQIMALLNLAPDIIEALLFMPLVISGKTLIHEKMLRPIAAEVDWSVQREMWEMVVKSAELEVN